MVEARKEAAMEIKASIVSATTIRDADALGSSLQRKFASASIWTDAMLAALQRGVTGGKWHIRSQALAKCHFADLGLFTMYEAHQLACQSR